VNWTYVNIRQLVHCVVEKCGWNICYVKVHKNERFSEYFVLGSFTHLPVGG